jgi:peptidyl-dipeptidase Dcp
LIRPDLDEDFMTQSTNSPSGNPFFESWETPYDLPPFGRIRPDHFMPAYERGMAEHMAEMNMIATSSDPATFANTIEALERSGRLMRRVGRVFWNLVGSISNPELQAIEREISPLLARHYSAITMNAELFARVEAVHRDCANQKLNAEQLRVLELTYKDFVRSGASLVGDDRQRMADIVARMAELTTRFGQNVLKDEADFMLVLDKQEDLAGLPQSLIASSASVAEERGHPGKHVITLSRSHVEPFLQFSQRRDLREILFSAWTKRGENGGETDNRAIIAEIVALRAERAKLLGYATFADYKLDDTMAKTTGNVRALLDRVWEGGLARASQEREELQAVMREDGSNEPLAAHDWRFYVEKLRKQKFDLDADEVSAYFQLDNVRAAAFDVANKLFGLNFEEVQNLELYHPDARAFDVKDRDGRHIALFITDDFARASKRSGAWMSAFRGQQKLEGDIRPIIVNALNVARPGDGQPALMTPEEARVIFHEFGHALHGMLSDVTYPSIAGTSVSRDFVELPSQLYEHWLLQPQVLRKYARHWKTGEVMPEHLLERVLAMRTFNQGFATVEYCSSAYVDMDLHGLEPPANVDPLAFEQQRLKAIRMPQEIVMRHRTPHFSHVFSGDGYAAGYYAYLWSEVLDADAFGAFEDSGDIFNPDLATRLKENIYAAGNRRPPDEAYVAFRGCLPSPDALMRKRGLVDTPAVA